MKYLEARKCAFRGGIVFLLSSNWHLLDRLPLLSWTRAVIIILTVRPHKLKYIQQTSLIKEYMEVSAHAHMNHNQDLNNV